MSSTEPDSKTDSTEERTDTDMWRTAAGDKLVRDETTSGQAEDVIHERYRTRNFQAIRVIRSIVGAIVVIALLFNIAGATQRVIENPAIGAIAFAAIAQLIQSEDVNQMSNILSNTF